MQGCQKEKIKAGEFSADTQHMNLEKASAWAGHICCDAWTRLLVSTLYVSSVRLTSLSLIASHLMPTSSSRSTVRLISL